MYDHFVGDDFASATPMLIDMHCVQDSFTDGAMVFAKIIPHKINGIYPSPCYNSHGLYTEQAIKNH